MCPTRICLCCSSPPSFPTPLLSPSLPTSFLPGCHEWVNGSMDQCSSTSSTIPFCHDVLLHLIPRVMNLADHVLNLLNYGQNKFFILYIFSVRYLHHKYANLTDIHMYSLLLLFFFSFVFSM